MQKLKLNQDDATLASGRNSIKRSNPEQLHTSRSAPELVNNNVNLDIELDPNSLVSSGGFIPASKMFLFEDDIPFLNINTLYCIFV